VRAHRSSSPASVYRFHGRGDPLIEVIGSNWRPEETTKELRELDAPEMPFHTVQVVSGTEGRILGPELFVFEES
jgi:hypothetical protein